MLLSILIVIINAHIDWKLTQQKKTYIHAHKRNKKHTCVFLLVYNFERIDPRYLVWR